MKIPNIVTKNKNTFNEYILITIIITITIIIIIIITTTTTTITIKQNNRVILN